MTPWSLDARSGNHTSRLAKCGQGEELISGLLDGRSQKFLTPLLGWALNLGGKYK